MEDKKRFKKIMERVGEVLRSKKLTKEFLRTYWEALEDYSHEEVETALKALVKERAYFPRPAVIINKIAESKNTFKFKREPNVCQECGRSGGIISEGKCRQCTTGLSGKETSTRFREIWEGLEKSFEF